MPSPCSEIVKEFSVDELLLLSTIAAEVMGGCHGNENQSPLPLGGV